MEYPAKASTVNGASQKAIKHQDTRLRNDEGIDYGRAETIEDIISELNATAKKDPALAEAFDDVILRDDGQQSIDALEQCDSITEVKDSTGSKDGGELGSTPTSAREEAKSAVGLADVSASAGGDITAATNASEVDSQDTSKVVKAANGDSDRPLENQEVSECTDTVETDGEEKSANECAEIEAVDVLDVANADDNSVEMITGEIKAPDEAVMSPRRTARQRTASLKVTENATISPRRKPRHGSETSDVSPVDSSSKQQELKKDHVTSDSEEVFIALSTRKLRKPSGEGSGAKIAVKAKVNRPISDSGGDSPLVKVKRNLKLAKKVPSESKTGSNIPAIMKRSPKLAKRLASDSEGDSPLAKRMRSPKLAKRLASSSEGDSPLVKRKGNARLANRISSEGDRSSPLAKRMGCAKGLVKKMPQHSETKKADAQSVEPPSMKKPRKSFLKELVENKRTAQSNGRRDLQSTEQSTKKGKPMASKVAQNLISKAKRAVFHVKECPVSNSISLAKHSYDVENRDSCRVPKPKKAKDKAGTSMEGTSDSSGAELMMVSKKNRALESAYSWVGLNAGNTGATGVARADDRGNRFTAPNSFAQSAEGARLPPHHFKASDRHLQKCIQLSTRKFGASARPSYLTIEVPSVTAGRMWGPTFTRQRPTVVFGGCDPMNTYVNLHGVRVLLHQWQKVSNITPTIRLVDIFRCFKHM
ncbi:hypothetical protein MRX96_003737 [Rhipicephalus microplus]|uniref:Putative nucleolar and coiled-body phosphoprotein 1-like isoform x1 ovary overexpressed n=1 Tax=Rhipicephalus microplus TaxID=6941 RepID=A0A6M2D0Z1_RHIMP